MNQDHRSGIPNQFANLANILYFTLTSGWLEGMEFGWGFIFDIQKTWVNRIPAPIEFGLEVWKFPSNPNCDPIRLNYHYCFVLSYYVIPVTQINNQHILKYPTFSHNTRIKYGLVYKSIEDWSASRYSMYHKISISNKNSKRNTQNQALNRYSSD